MTLLLNTHYWYIFAQISKLEINAYRCTPLPGFFYSQFIFAIALFRFCNRSVSFCLAFSMYFWSSVDGLNNLSISIPATATSSQRAPRCTIVVAATVLDLNLMRIWMLFTTQVFLCFFFGIENVTFV